MENSSVIEVQNVDPVPPSTFPVPQTTIPSSVGDQKKIIVLVILGLVLVTLGAFYFLNVKKNLPTPVTNNSKPSQESPSPIAHYSTANITNINWLEKPELVPSVGFFQLVDKYYPFKYTYCRSNTQCDPAKDIVTKTDPYEPKAKYYHLGTMNAQGKYPGAEVYMGVVKGLADVKAFKGWGTENDIVHDQEVDNLFLKTTDGKFVVTKDRSNNLIFCPDGCPIDSKVSPSPAPAPFILDPDLTIELDQQKSSVYTPPNSKHKFQIQVTDQIFDSTSLFLVKDFGDGWKLYSDQDIQSPKLSLSQVISPKLILRLPTGFTADVSLSNYNELLIGKKSENPNSPTPQADNTGIIQWSEGVSPQLLSAKPSSPSPNIYNSSVAYGPDFDGCTGTLTLQKLVPGFQLISIGQDLNLLGSVDTGGQIYELKDNSNQIFEKFWNAHVLNQFENLNYNQYLDLKPIIIWRDEFGIVRMMFRTDLLNSSCWAEPLIYLYPTQPTQVSVQLDPRISLTQSQPIYKNGWQVEAYSDGRLFDLQTQRSYPYLYWEGSAPSNLTPVSRAVVEKTEIHTYLENELDKLGLNQKEKTDFENFWEPKMQTNSFYTLSFFGTESLESVVPLNIQPKPDTVIRVLFTYQDSDQKPDVEEFENTQPVQQRTGFTVVEWGGVLHNHIY